MHEVRRGAEGSTGWLSAAVETAHFTKFLASAQPGLAPAPSPRETSIRPVTRAVPADELPERRPLVENVPLEALRRAVEAGSGEAVTGVHGVWGGQPIARHGSGVFALPWTD